MDRLIPNCENVVRRFLVPLLAGDFGTQMNRSGAGG
jgi:hypothetical protein